MLTQSAARRMEQPISEENSELTMEATADGTAENAASQQILQQDGHCRRLPVKRPWNRMGAGKQCPDTARNWKPLLQDKTEGKMQWTIHLQLYQVCQCSCHCNLWPTNINRFCHCNYKCWIRQPPVSARSQ